jgi:hypothetical protein
MLWRKRSTHSTWCRRCVFCNSYGLRDNYRQVKFSSVQSITRANVLHLLPYAYVSLLGKYCFPFCCNWFCCSFSFCRFYLIVAFLFYCCCFVVFIYLLLFYFIVVVLSFLLLLFCRFYLFVAFLFYCCCFVVFIYLLLFYFIVVVLSFSFTFSFCSYLLFFLGLFSAFYSVLIVLFSVGVVFWSYYCCPWFCCCCYFDFFSFFSLFLFSAFRGSVQSLPVHTDISLKSFKPFHLDGGDIFTQTTYSLKYKHFGMRKTRGLPLGRVERCIPNSSHKSQKLVETVQGGQDVWPGYCHLEGQLMPLHIQYVCTPNKVVINLSNAHSVSSSVRSVANFTAKQPH